MRLAVVFLFSLIVFSPLHAAPLSVGDTAPNWILPVATGEELEYYPDSEDRVSMVLFWATWCPYCAKLMPHLQEVYKNYRDKGLRFYAIDIYEDGDLDPVSYFARRGYTYTLLLYGDLVADEYGVNGTPSLFVIDKDKKIIYSRKSGTSDNQVKQDVIQAIETAMK